MESGKPETSSKIIPDRQKLEYCAKVLLTNTFIELPSNARSEIYKLESYLVKTNELKLKISVASQSRTQEHMEKYHQIISNASSSLKKNFYLTSTNDQPNLSNLNCYIDPPSTSQS
ncbi:14024_t:CDS:2 [Entrophospora sp. SA101]|nr:14024_t:CDS:2 [Entrophospora sp. SA101]